MRNPRFLLLLAGGLVGIFAACGDDDAATGVTPGIDGGASTSGTTGSTSSSGGTTSSGGSTSGNPTDGGMDSGTDSGADSGPPGYDVKKLPNLVLWLESNTGVDLGAAATPAKWSDQSGKGNDAVQKPGECGKPDRNANMLNGHIGLGFHETECLQIADNATLQFGTGDFYIGAVARNYANTATSTDPGTVFKYQDGSYTRRRYGEVYSKIPSLFGPGPAIVFNDWTDKSRKIVGTLDLTEMVKTPNIYGEPGHLIGFRRKGEVLELHVDDAVKSTMTDAGAPIDVSNAGTPIAIGGRANLTEFVGSIWEIVVIKGTMSDADLKDFETYAIAKYKLPGPND